MVYAGDVGPTEAYQALAADPDAILIDVRTRAELVYVGHADLSPIGKRVAAVEWQPVAGGHDPAFASRLDSLELPADAPIYLICRSGSRSRFAAIAATAGGYERVYNVSNGFEGPIDTEGHRGSVAGWKAEGLPWRQS